MIHPHLSLRLFFFNVSLVPFFLSAFFLSLSLLGIIVGQDGLVGWFGKIGWVT